MNMTHLNLAHEIEEMVNRERITIKPGSYIFKELEMIRELDKESYTCRLVSIGPYHHGDRKLMSIEC